MTKLPQQTKDLTQENIKRIAELFPEAITETKDEQGQLKTAINFSVLKQLLSNEVVDGDECYEFTWVGKKQAMIEANRPIRKTLRPAKSESKNWDTTENLYIEGDNLDVLKLLQNSYLNSIKMIYIDPPYNTGNDFVYRDDFAQSREDYEEEMGVYDEDENRLFKNTETNGRFHSDWCSMMYPRLQLARKLLSDDGVIFISIDDNEVDNLRKICDEVFGEDNFLGLFITNSTPNARDYGHIGKMHEFVLFYGKNSVVTETNMLPVIDKSFTYTDEVGGYNIHPLYNSNEAFNNLNRPNLYYPFYLYLDKTIDKNFFEIGLEKKGESVEIFPPLSLKNKVQFVWRWGKEKAKSNLNQEIIGYKTNSGEYRIVQKMRHSEKIIRSLLSDTKYSSRRGTAEVEEILKGKIFSFPKPISLLYDFVKIGTNDNSTILDLFSGSSTTAHAVMQLNAEDGGNRKFIMVQLPEATDPKSEAYKAGYKNICEIGKERIRRAGDKITPHPPKGGEEIPSNSPKRGEQSNLFDGAVDAEGAQLLPSGEVGRGLDTGFRVLKLDDTNMKDVYYSADEYSQEKLLDLESNIKDDRSDMDLLFGVLIDWGVPLSLPHRTETIAGKQVHFVNDTDLVACFEENVNETVVREIAKHKPLRVVFRDSSFSSSPEKINVTEIFKTLSGDTTIKVI
jgi:adenine-specific DNA-methyltransferase